MNLEKEFEKVRVLLEHFNCNWKELNRYRYRNAYYDLRSAYGKCSYVKQKAFVSCLKLNLQLDGEGGAIASRNAQTFTYNFTFTLFGVRMYAFITKAYNRIGFYGMDREEGIREFAKNWQLYYQDYDVSYDELYNFQTLLNEMLGKRNKALKEELRENGIL